jgi:hypothetical protein
MGGRGGTPSWGQRPQTPYSYSVFQLRTGFIDGGRGETPSWGQRPQTPYSFGSENRYILNLTFSLCFT